MKKRFLFVFLVIALVFSACACASDEIPLNIPSDNVSHMVEYVPYGHYIYFSFGWAYRADIREGSYASACFDPSCDGNCPLDNIEVQFCGEENGKIYFISQNHMERKEYFAYQDASTGKVTCLAEYSDNETNGSMGSIIDNGYWYYNVMLLKSGGEKTNPNDFVSTICRMSTETGKIETLFQLDTNERMRLVVDEKVITTVGTTLYAYDIAASEKVPLFDIKNIDGTAFRGVLSYYNGKYYFSVLTNEKAISEYLQSSVKLQYLYRLDAQSGECVKLTDKPVDNYYVANDGIYFSETEWHCIYLPDDWENHLDEVKESSMGTTLYRLDDQGIKTVAYESNDSGVPSSYVVFDGILYGTILISSLVPNEKDGKMELVSTMKFGTIDLSSGELSYCEKQE